MSIWWMRRHCPENVYLVVRSDTNPSDRAFAGVSRCSFCVAGDGYRGREGFRHVSIVRAARKDQHSRRYHCYRRDPFQSLPHG